jgi:murein DD-endopeptidase MepM/ murein hydrolase activator NlpD
MDKSGNHSPFMIFRSEGSGPVHSGRVGFLVLSALTVAVVGLVPAHADQDKPKDRKKKVDGQVRDIRTELDGSARRLATAEAAYAAAEQSLPAAQAVLEDARVRLDEARRHDGELKAKLDQALADEQRAARELADVGREMDSMHTTLGQVIRRSYQQGALAQLSAVIEAETPGDMVSRLESFRSVIRSDASTLERLRTTKHELDVRQLELERSRQLVRAQRDQARGQLLAQEELQRRAEQAAAEVKRLIGQREGAVATARQEKAADQRRYAELQEEQRKLAELVNRVNAPARGGLKQQPGRGQGGALSYPAAGEVSSGYGMRYHPILEYTKLHTGTDFAVAEGTQVRAARAGTVVSAGFNSAYGNRVVVSHGRVGGVALTTTYNHLSKIGVREGQKLDRGENLGRSGNTGYSTGPHLHFEVLVDGGFTDPMTWL